MSKKWFTWYKERKGSRKRTNLIIDRAGNTSQHKYFSKIKIKYFY